MQEQALERFFLGMPPEESWVHNISLPSKRWLWSTCRCLLIFDSYSTASKHNTSTWVFPSLCLDLQCHAMNLYEVPKFLESGFVVRIDYSTRRRSRSSAKSLCNLCIPTGGDPAARAALSIFLRFGTGWAGFVSVCFGSCHRKPLCSSICAIICHNASRSYQSRNLHVLHSFLKALVQVINAKKTVISATWQDFLKQSATRINFIGDKVVAMTLEMYRAPRRMVEEISALGLRHVGYAIPTEVLLGRGMLKDSGIAGQPLELQMSRMITLTCIQCAHAFTVR